MIAKTNPGHPLPYGTTRQRGGINFSLMAKHASSVTLVLIDTSKNQTFEIPLNPEINKTGDAWHIFIESEENNTLEYSYKIEGPTCDPQRHSYDSSKVILDPYAKAVHSPIQWGTLGCGDKDSYRPYGLIPLHAEFDWEDDKSPQTQQKDLVIYEMHVRGFTQHRSSTVKSPGTFLGVIEKIPHLIELGINAVELMPLQEFNECEYQVRNPLICEKLFQYWGYSTVNFFAPMNRYASSESPGAVIHEFKSMVKALHKNGIVVILDIVLNHTNEGGVKGPINSFKGIDNCLYYMIDPLGNFLDFTGCGNTFNVNQPAVQSFILDVLRYWVLEMHVDGFRFDLASIFSRGTQGEVLSRSCIIEAISLDPILSKTMLIAEPWDVGGLYQVGSFYPYKSRWSEWNARYRDAVRRFIRGTPNIKGKFAWRISGSQDIYGTQSPTCSINFIVAHDGFTLNDLVSYNQKHNLSNGENNHDGLSENDSWNCGWEGPTNDPTIQKLRARQMRNFHLALMISQGIPMLLMGDEYGHTKKGNNNTWCHDNELNYFLWDKLQENKGFYRYYRKLIEFRKQHPVLHQGRFLTEKDVTWWGIKAQKTAWDQETNFLAFTLTHEEGKVLYCAFNAQNVQVDIELPLLKKGQEWHLTVNTANEPPLDFYDPEEAPIVNQKPFEMLPFSALLLCASYN